jgi:hypothetical protein
LSTAEREITRLDVYTVHKYTGTEISSDSDDSFTTTGSDLESKVLKGDVYFNTVDNISYICKEVS